MGNVKVWFPKSMEGREGTEALVNVVPATDKVTLSCLSADAAAGRGVPGGG